MTATLTRAASVTCGTCGGDVPARGFCVNSAECRLSARLLQVRSDLRERALLGLPQPATRR